MEVLTPYNLAAYEQEPAPSLPNSNFEWSFKFLPPEKRNAIFTIYNLLSYIDNIVDIDNYFTVYNNQELLNKKLERINRWNQIINDIYDDSKNVSSYLAPLRYVVKRFSIPQQYFEFMFNGFRRDLTQNRYQTFEELKEYMFEVASVVGLIVIEIFGYRYDTTRQYAINLGFALQLTNILRDIKTDKDRGYIYLPQEDLTKFDYTTEDIFNEEYNDNFVELMHFEAQRAKHYFHQARLLLRPDERKSMFSAGIMDEIYFRLLEKIELNEYNVYKKKIKVSSIHKFMIALKHFLSLKLFVNRIKRLPN